MKAKVYMPSVAIVRASEADGKPFTNLFLGGAFNTLESARKWACASQESYRETVEVDGEKVIKWKDNILDVVWRVKDEVIDTDDLEEYEPEFEVEISVKVEKRITVIVTADQIKERGYDLDEYGASSTAEELCGEDEYESDLLSEPEWDVEIETIESNEV